MKTKAHLIAPCAVFTLLLSAASLTAADWPHWVGPNGDNIAPTSDKVDLDLSKWQVKWTTNVGFGYSAVAVAGGRACTVGHDGKSNETVFCFDAATGAPVWQHAYPAQLMSLMHPGGPNATPTFSGGKVFSLSKDGQVFCLSADSGAVLWTTNLTEVMGVKLPRWGFASSPVVLDGKVLFSAGKVAAFDMNSGALAWLSQTANPPGYTTPVVFSKDGREFVADLHARGLTVVAAKDGTEIAAHPFKSQFDVTAPTPMVSADGSRILIAGNASAELLSFDGKALSAVWSSTDLKNSLNNSVRYGSDLYGIDGGQDSPAARFVCVNWDDGKLRWAKDSFGYGTVIGIGKDALLSLTESGELVAIKASPGAYSEISRKQVLGKKCWTTPVFAENRIYVRNDRGDVACLAKD